METASPPTFYIPRDDVNFDLLVPVSDTTYCEWKGTATYWALTHNLTEPVGWCYERPRPRFEVIKRYLAFYPGRVDCRLGGEQVTRGKVLALLVPRTNDRAVELYVDGNDAAAQLAPLRRGRCTSRKVLRDILVR